MEAYFTQAECSQCGEIFAAEDHPEGTYCEHLNKRFDTKASAGDQVFRRLKGFILGGAGVVEDPADVDAEALAIAARPKEAKSLDKIELTQAELKAQIDEAVEKALAEAAKNADVDELKARAEAAEKEAKEKADALAEATETIAALTTERDEAKASLKELEDKAAWGAKAAERKTALDEAGYQAPENEEEAEAAFAKFVDMADDVFELFTTTVKAGAKKVDPAEKTQASARVPTTGGTAKASEKKLSDTEVAADILARL
jgi:colicin import membrane protein